MKRFRILLATNFVIASLTTTTPVAAANDPDSLQRFKSIYKELVETNTTLSAGDCTLAA
jgi:hypothetical protein